jgi:phage repressor protein C with HTH and peptisase S24 domain
LRDGIHVVRLGEALHVKRVQAGKPGTLTLISANAAYPPIEAGLDDVDVIGRVVWKSGRL